MPAIQDIRTELLLDPVLGLAGWAKHARKGRMRGDIHQRSARITLYNFFLAVGHFLLAYVLYSNLKTTNLRNFLLPENARDFPRKSKL